MPSRKRNKGKARKAKTAGSDGGSTIANAGGDSRGNSMSPTIDGRLLEEMTNCRHGLTPQSPHGDVIRECIYAFAKKWAKMVKHQEYSDCSWSAVAVDAMAMTISLPELLPEFTPIWHDESHRNLMKETLYSMGAHLILEQDMEQARASAAAALLLENYDSTKTAEEVTKGFGDFDKECIKYKDTFEGCDRSLIRFIKKRIPCSCLDQKYEEAKNDQAKTGVCRFCFARQERSTLMVCSSCRARSYCSKLCQMADWPSHKEDCKKLTGLRK